MQYTALSATALENSTPVHMTDMAENPHMYGKFQEVKIAIHQRLGKRKSIPLSASNVTEYSRIISDWMIILQYLEIKREIPDCQMR